MKCYVLGKDQLPPHIAEKVVTYQASSGDCGYELCGKFRNYEGCVGDLLIVEDKRMYIKRF